MRGGGRGQREKCVLRKREREGGIGQVGIDIRRVISAELITV